MNMDEFKNPNKKKLSEQLPSHSPDPGTWQRLSGRLDALDAETVYQEKLQQLPVHSPDQGTWKIIYSRLNRIAFYKTSLRIALSVAAGLLLFFTVSRVADTYQNSSDTNTKTLVSQKQTTHPVMVASRDDSRTETQVKDQESKSPSASAPSVKYSVAPAAGIPNELSFNFETEIIPPDIDFALRKEIAGSTENNMNYLLQKTAIHDQHTIPVTEILKTDLGSKIALLQNEPLNSATKPPVKYYSPKEPKQTSNKNYFALAMNYLPENINNGTNNSLFHNVDLTASYNKEKVRFNTSLGMAYNEEQLEFAMNYDIKTPVTSIGPGGQLDTIRYSTANVESDYMGTEKHQYFTYNLGIGRKLFSFGKFSSWINAGAGFGIRLNNPDLISSTEKSIKGQYNAMITSVNTSKPEYNNVNVNFVTGIDFNYKILKRISITFTPTSRWYFKPVLIKDNQATDELTLGFKTGMKFEF